MVRKTVAAVLLGAGFGAGLVGCGGDQEAIGRYIGQQLKPALEVEAAALAPLWTLSSVGQSDSERLAKDLAGQVLPAYERFLNEFAAMTVAEPVAELHGRYLALANQRSEALNMLLEAARQEDSQKLQEANARRSELAEQRRQWKESLRRLCEEHGLVLGGR